MQKRSIVGMEHYILYNKILNCKRSCKFIFASKTSTNISLNSKMKILQCKLKCGIIDNLFHAPPSSFKLDCKA